MATAAELRALADQLDAVEAAEAAARDAKDAYRANPTDDGLKAAHRAASQALADTRQSRRGSPTIAVEPGSTVVIPPSVTARKG
jgi:hypothetical protein